MTIPTITTPRLVLRAFTMEDVEPLYHILRGEDVLRYFPPMEPPPRERVQKMVAGLLQHWETRGYGLWAVASPSGGRLMGRCGLQWLPDTGEVEVDYILGRAFWGQGFATEAARASLRYGFEELELERVIGISHVENIASQRVLEKLGMARLEQKEFFGIPCYRYAIDRSAYHKASQVWDSGVQGR